MGDNAGGQKIGGAVGGIGGAAVGTYYGGPVGGAVGGFVGSYLGGAIGGGIGSLFGGNSGPNAQQAQALKDEQAQRDRLIAIAKGNGPSVAGLQLGQGLEQINRGIGSEVAGTRGEGGVLARYGQMQAGAQAAAAENQAAAIARAQEAAQAQQALAGLTSSTLGTTTGASTAANNLQWDKDKTILGAGLQGASSLGAHLSSSSPSTTSATPSSGGDSSNSIGLTPPTDEDGLFTLSS